MKKMRCPNCGEMIDENEKVCPICAEDTGFGEEPKEPQEEHVAEEPEIVEESPIQEETYDATENEDTVPELNDSYEESYVSGNKENNNKSGKKNLFIVIGSALVIVCVAVLLFFLLKDNKSATATEEKPTGMEAVLDSVINKLPEGIQIVGTFPDDRASLFYIKDKQLFKYDANSDSEEEIKLNMEPTEVITFAGLDPDKKTILIKTEDEQMKPYAEYRIDTYSSQVSKAVGGETVTETAQEETVDSAANETVEEQIKEEAVTPQPENAETKESNVEEVQKTATEKKTEPSSSVKKETKKPVKPSSSKSNKKQPTKKKEEKVQETAPANSNSTGFHFERL